jgi:hypothetical protein
MATPEIASGPPTINFGVMRSPRNNTLEIKANTGSSRPKGATRSMEQGAISQNQRPRPIIPPMTRYSVQRGGAAAVDESASALVDERAVKEGGARINSYHYTQMDTSKYIFKRIIRKL